MVGRRFLITLMLLTFGTHRGAADVVEESEKRVLKGLSVVVLAVDVSPEAAKVGLTSEVVTKEVSKALKSSKVEEAKPEVGKARPVFIVKLFLAEEFKKAKDINDAPETAGADGDSHDATKKPVAPTKKSAKKEKGEEQLAGYLTVRIVDLAKIERLGDQPVSVNSFLRVYPFLARPAGKTKEAVIDGLIGKTFKHDFRGLVKEARASGSP